MQNKKRQKQIAKKSNPYQVIDIFQKNFILIFIDTSSLYDIICNTFQNDPELSDLYKKNS